MGSARAAGSSVRWFIATTLVSVSLCGLTSVCASAGDVRPMQARGRRLLAQGNDGSLTFKQLLDRIAQSDVIAFVDLDPADERKLEGALQFVSSASGTRYVKVWLQPRRTDFELIVTLGHELQHVVEVVDAPQVVNQATFAALFAQTGKSDKEGHFETRAAQQVARRIRTELRPGRVRLIDSAASLKTRPADVTSGSFLTSWA